MHEGGVGTVAESTAGHHARLESVQALRGIAAILVVLFHAHQFQLDARYFGRPPMGGFWAWGLHGIDLFFVISGFVMAHVHFEDFRRGTGWKRFLVSRVSRIYMPYWPILAMLAVIYFAMPWLGRESMRDPITILRSALLWPGTNGLLSVAWTLQHEMVFYFVVMIALMRPAVGALLFVLWQLYAALAGATTSIGSETAKLWLGPYEIEFAFGIACMLMLRRFPASSYPRAILAAGVASFSAIALYTTYVRDFTPVTFTSTISYGLAASAILVGAVYCERARCLRIPRLAVILGGASYSIYLIHYPLISVLSKLLHSFGMFEASSAAPVLLELSLSCVAVGCLYHTLVERRLIAVSRVVLGRAIGADRRPSGYGGDRPAGTAVLTLDEAGARKLAGGVRGTP